MLDKRHVDRVFRITPAPNEPLATTSVWVGLYDGYFWSAVCLDSFHGTLHYASGCDFGASTSDDFGSYCPADVPLTISRISGRFVRTAHVALDRGDIFAASWVLAATVKTTLGLYLTYGLLGGIGTGIIYVGVVGLMVGWFPDRRGFACGIVAAGYGMGAFLTTFPISGSLAAVGPQSTLITFGLIFGAIGLLAAQGMKRPPTNSESSVPGSTQTRAGVPPLVMLRSPIFWVLFVMMSMMSSSGLMVITQMAAFAKDVGVANAMVFGTAALPLALTIDRFTNGLTRPFFGWLSDRIGREQTMFLAFGLEGLAMLLWLATRQHAILFVLLSGVVFFGWGEIFSLFPSTLTDTFGERHATTNYGFLYMAQGIGSIVGAPLAAWLHEVTGNWIIVFAVMIVMDFLAAIMAIAVLKPLRRGYTYAPNALTENTPLPI